MVYDICKRIELKVQFGLENEVQSRQRENVQEKKYGSVMNHFEICITCNLAH